MNINLKDSPFVPRLLFRYLSLFLVGIQVLVFFPLLTLTDLAIFFLLKSFHDTIKRLFNGLSGTNYYKNNYNPNHETRENLIYHYFIHFIISFFSALITSLLIFFDSITINIFNNFSTLDFYDYIFFIIWFTTSFASNPANFITQIFKHNKLTGFITVFSSTFFITPIILIFYLQSNITLSALLFSYGMGNLINFLIVTFSIIRIINIKHIPKKTISTFKGMINLNESIIGFTSVLRWQSILWFLTINNENDLAIIFGFFNYLFPLVFFPSNSIFASLRSDFFAIVESENKKNLKNFINQISRLNVIYFAIITICSFLAFTLNDFIISYAKLLNIEFLLYLSDISLLFIAAFSAYFFSNIIFKSLEGTIIGLRKFNETNIINILTVITLFISVSILGNYDNIYTWLISIFIAQFVRSGLMYLYLAKILKAI